MAARAVCFGFTVFSYQRDGQNTLMAENWFLEEILLFPEKERHTKNNRERDGPDLDVYFTLPC